MPAAWVCVAALGAAGGLARARLVRGECIHMHNWSNNELSPKKRELLKSLKSQIDRYPPKLRATTYPCTSAGDFHDGPRGETPGATTGRPAHERCRVCRLSRVDDVCVTKASHAASLVIELREKRTRKPVSVVRPGPGAARAGRGPSPVPRELQLRGRPGARRRPARISEVGSLAHPHAVSRRLTQNSQVAARQRCAAGRTARAALTAASARQSASRHTDVAGARQPRSSTRLAHGGHTLTHAAGCAERAVGFQPHGHEHAWSASMMVPRPAYATGAGLGTPARRTPPPPPQRSALAATRRKT